MSSPDTVRFLVIDDNYANANLLGEAVHKHSFSDAQITWLRLNLGPLDLEPEHVDTMIDCRDVATASDHIVALTSDSTIGWIIFYDLQFTLIQERDYETSPLTLTLKRLVSSGSSVLVAVHSGAGPTWSVAEVIRGQSTKGYAVSGILTKFVTPEQAKAVVEDARARWMALYPPNGPFGRSRVAFDRFMRTMTVLNHDQLQLIDSEKIALAALAQFLRMTQENISATFLACGSGPLSDALKNIGGVVDATTGTNECRPACFGAGWLLALGQFQNLFHGRDWREYFDSNQFTRVSWADGRIQPRQTTARRLRTLEYYYDMCGRLFWRRGADSAPSLRQVKLQLLGSGSEFTFDLDFASDGGNGASVSESSLFGRLFALTDHTLAGTAPLVAPLPGENAAERHRAGQEQHDTSTAIWRYAMASSVFDHPIAVRRGYPASNFRVVAHTDERSIRATRVSWSVGATS